MVHTRAVFLIGLLGLFACPVGGTQEMVEKQIPLPIEEMTDVLVRWWQLSGFRVERTEGEGGGITLRAVKDGESWQVDLSPRSALATRVTVHVSAVAPDSRREQLWDHLSHYLEAPPVETIPGSAQRIPAAVLSKIQSVVCINARSEEKSVQFSGFIVGKEGFVLCTAHDLLGPQNFTVTLYDGQEVRGSLLHKDPALDISLIQIALKTKDAINLAEGRNLLGMGEALYTVGCPVNLRGTVYAGAINGPPRRMNDQLLWQAHMEIYPGSSGSPVFDGDGHVVAMVKGRYRGTSTTAFLIPMETIYHFLKEKKPL